ncbi:hypothetical protein ALNOE001_20250 [Candidatus Methanobinarius endosymbioticus]|uniref:Glycosyltransferase RgtA/B/C/D-like domain-containing protein n=1 Tax=Candidatus Methanobinarius endosymbioticus TaxID=2006182 RepID=A0A366M7Z0_9EURY|nr:hypothetical protein ALNOE001_20250 [Candidatus Methanobinarius endosymbioticus]
MKNTKIKSLVHFFKSNETKLSFLFILLFSSIITILLIWINTSHEILGSSYRDVYFYLIKSLRFSGYSIGGYEYVNYLSPLIPFLTSFLFKLGFVNETSIFIVTGIFYILGVLGVFSLLKLRFRNIMAIFGTIIYTGLSINLIWVANGTLDIPSVSLTILAIYLFVIGVEKNQKYFYLAFPVAMLGFFAKYTAGLAIPLMFLYILSKPDIKNTIPKYWKNVIGSLGAGSITSIPFMAYFYINKIPLGFLNQAKDIASKTTIVSEVNNNLFYYFTNIPRFIYNPNHILSYIIIFIVVLGLIIGIYILLMIFRMKNMNVSQYISKNRDMDKIHSNYFLIMNKKISNKLVYFLIIVSIFVMFISFLTASTISFVYSELIFFVLAFIFSYLLNKLIKTLPNNKFFRFDLLMFSWFFSYLIFFSAHLVKVDRYFITMAPTFVFFVTLALNTLLNLKPLNYKKNSQNKNKSPDLSQNNYQKFNSDILENKDILNENQSLNQNQAKNNWRKVWKINIKPNIKNLIPLLLIVIFLISSFGYLTLDKHDSLAHDERETVNWIKNHDPNYNSKVIWAERGPIFTWYFKKEIIYVNWEHSPQNLSEMMKGNNTTYFIALSPEENIPGYSSVKKIGKVTIYQRNTS